MIPDFKYNHDADNFFDAVGIAKDFEVETLKKINRILNDLNQIDELSPSRILEEMIAVCSDEQIAFLALNYIGEQVNKQLKDNE